MEWTTVVRLFCKQGVAARLVTGVAMLLGCAALGRAQPSNDTCTGAIALTLGTPFSGTNALATSTGDGAASACLSSVKSGVFFTYTPSLPGVYRLSLCDSPTHDTVLTVFGISSCADITSATNIIACNDDSGTACAGERSSLDVPMQGGVTYLIRVQTWSGAISGAYVLRIDGTGACCRPNGDCFQTAQNACTGAGTTFTPAATCSPYPCSAPAGAPANNACENAIVIDPATLPTTILGSTATASSEGQSGCGTTSLPSGKDVFFRFTPAVAGQYQFSLCGSPEAWDSLISVHTGCPASFANQVAGSCNNTASPACDGGNTQHARVLLTLSAGVAYTVRVAGGTTAATGAFALEAARILPGACCRPSGDCTFEPSPLACAAGNTYVSGGACSPYPCTGPMGAPENNLCENAAVFPSAGGVVIGTAVNASSEGLGCGLGTAPLGKDVFYTFTPTLTGDYRLSLCGSATNWDTVLSVHDGCPTTSANLSNMAVGSCGDTASPPCGAHAQITALRLVAGQMYVLRVAGVFNSTAPAPFSLNVGILGACCSTSGTCAVDVQTSCASGATFVPAGTCATNTCPQPPAPRGDVCVDPVIVPAAGGTASTTLLGARSENTAISGACGNPAGRDVYFRFTPEAGGAYRFSTCESASQDAVMSLHTQCPTSSTVSLLTPDPMLDCSTDGCSGGLLPTIAASTPLVAGRSYIIRVGIAGESAVGDGVGGPLTLRVTRLGACCRPEGSCTITIEGDCSGLGSTYQIGAVCTPMNPCPQPMIPVNAACTLASVIDATGAEPFVVSGTVANATPGDAGCGASGGLDVFYAFTPPVTGSWTLSLCGSGLVFDTTIAVHAACPATAANILASGCDDDACGTLGHGRVTVNLTAGTAYIIRIATDGLPSTPNYGPFTLRISRPGACCTPSGSVQGVCAVVDADRCTGLSVFLGPATTCTPMNMCAISGACCAASGACYPALAATCAASAVFSSGMTCLAACTGMPPGDSCANPSPLTLGAAVDAGNTFATSINDGPNPPAGQCAGNDSGGVFRGLWYSFTPTHTAAYRVSTCGSSFDTLVLAYRSVDCTAGGFTFLACDDNACAGGAGEPGPGGLPGSTNAGVIGSVVLTAGTQYLFRAQSFSAFEAGNIRMLVTAASALGACCLTSTNTCSLTDASRCPGFFFAGSTCTPGLCPAVCCRGATCSIRFETDCTVGSGLNAGARWFGALFECNSGNTASPCCLADYNKLDGITVNDILDYLNDWFAQSPLAGTGTSGGQQPTVNQLLDFLNAWFAGCA